MLSVDGMAGKGPMAQDFLRGTSPKTLPLVARAAATDQGVRISRHRRQKADKAGPLESKENDRLLGPPLLHGLALALAHHCGLSGRTVERRSRRRVISPVSGNAEHENAPGTGECDQHGGPLAGTTYLG